MKIANTICRAAATHCDVAEACDGVSASCPADVFQPSTTVARNASGDCDTQEFCTGTSATIPTDNFKAQGTVCRPAVSMCDVVELCTGSGAFCPADSFAPDTTLVHVSTSNDDCDPAEYCSGIDSTVPVNEENCSRISINVLGQSGKFTIFDQAKGNTDPVSLFSYRTSLHRECIFCNA